MSDKFLPADGSTVTIDFSCIAVVPRKRVKKHGQTYTNLHCGHCGNWFIMMCIGKRKKAFCPWCGRKLKVKLVK